MSDKIGIPESAKVVIIGGGPAGAATAISLQQRGIKAVIVEAAPSVKPKIGETLPPNCIPLLQQLGIEALVADAVHLPSFGNKFIWGSEKEEEKHFIFQKYGSGWQLKRQYFEEQLIHKIRGKDGLVLQACKLIQVQRQAEAWLLKLQREGELSTIACDFVVDASGRSAKLTRLIGCQREEVDGLVGLSYRFPVANPEKIPQFTHVEAVESGWWYAALLSTNELVVVFMTDVDLLERKMLQATGFLAQAKKTTLIAQLFEPDYTSVDGDRVKTQSASTSCLKQTFGTNWLAVGDAAFAYDPISSYGISSALGSGFYAGHAIADHFLGKTEALPAYRKIMEQAFLQYLRFWKKQYLVEMRWSESPFWKRRHELF